MFPGSGILTKNTVRDSGKPRRDMSFDCSREAGFAKMVRDAGFAKIIRNAGFL